MPTALENHIADLIAATAFIGVICIPSIIYESIQALRASGSALLVLIGNNKD